MFYICKNKKNTYAAEVDSEVNEEENSEATNKYINAAFSVEA